MSSEAGRLAGKVAIVTGAASGFGAGIATQFVAEGAHVVIADRNGEGAEALANQLGAAAKGFSADVSRDADVAALAEAATAFAGDVGGGRVDIVVNNAGIGQLPKPLESVDEAEFDRLLQVNVKSVYLTARHLVPAMKAGGGAILNIASTGGVSPRPNLAWYNASKGWMIAATRAMAIELARWQIRVNAINPVAGDTPLLATFMGGEDTPAARERILTTIPLRRLSTPADIASAAVFLCSDEASMITGVALEVDGGRCL